MSDREEAVKKIASTGVTIDEWAKGMTEAVNAAFPPSEGEGERMSITEFLTARWGEEEAVARLVLDKVSGGRYYEDAEGCAASAFFNLDYSQGGFTITAERALADIAAKRAIVELHTLDRGTDGEECSQCSFHELYEGFNDVSEPWPCLTLRLLAQPYADHPDFDPAWRV